MEQEKEGLDELLERTSDDYKGKSSLGDGIKPAIALQTPTADEKDVDIDDEELGKYLINALKNDVTDRDDAGWLDDRDYDKRSYFQVKDDYFSHIPWEGASNFVEPITAVLLDTGQAAIEDILFRNKLKATIVKGVGKEDRISSENLERILNWQILTNTKRFVYEMSANIFQMLLHGTSYFKVIKSIKDGEYRLSVFTIPIDRIFLPIDNHGPDLGDTDRVTQIVPLQANDLLERINSGVYRNLNKVSKGLNIGGNSSTERMLYLEAQITGLDLTTKQNRDTYFLAETPVTYYPKGSTRKRELVVTWSPNTGAIHRKIENKDGIRSFVDFFCYPNYHRAYHRSLPTILRNIQEKANYVDKQVTDGGDKAMSPAAFFNEGSGMYPQLMLRAPTGMYAVKNLGAIQWEPINIAPLMERKQEVRELWLKAERVSGFSDLYQGTAGAQTLGQEVMKKERTDIRTAKILRFINESWGNVVRKFHEYNDRYMPRDMVIEILGTDEQYSIDQMFPSKASEDGTNPVRGLNIKGKFNYSIANKTVVEEDAENQKKDTFANQVLIHPVLGQDIDNVSRCFNKKAEAMGIRDTSEYFNAPKESYDASPEEVIQRVMNGEKDIAPAIYKNPTEYEVRIKIFMRSENFKLASDEVKNEFVNYLRNIEIIRKSKIMAKNVFLKSQTVEAVQAGQELQNAKKGIKEQGSVQGNLPAKNIPTPNTAAESGTQ